MAQSPPEHGKNQFFHINKMIPSTQKISSEMNTYSEKAVNTPPRPTINESKRDFSASILWGGDGDNTDLPDTVPYIFSHSARSA
jgi:hypothetical protein